jgi:uncharacterized protein YhdP
VLTLDALHLASAEFLRFVEASPVAAWTDHAMDGVQATGSGRLALRLEMRPSDPQDRARVSGELQLADNQVKVPGLPPFSRVNGRLAFSEREVNARDLAFEAFGGAGRLTIANRDGATRVTGSGTANLATLRSELKGLPLERVTGTTDWRLDLAHRGGATNWTIESNLRGASVDLPPPLRKAAAEPVAFRLERRPLPGEPARDTIVAQFGDDVRVVAVRRGNGQDAAV